MYNESIKSQFIGTLAKETQGIYASIFSRIEKLEEEIGKDCAEFNLNECIETINFLAPKSFTHLSVLKSQMSKYTNWRVEYEHLEFNYWLLVPEDEEFVKASFGGRYVKDINQLESIVNSALRVPYDKYVVYLLYMGIMGSGFKELALIKDTDVNKQDGVLTTIRGEYTMVAPLKHLVVNGEYYEDSRKAREEDSPYFIKPFKSKNRVGDPVTPQNIYRAFVRMNTEWNRTYPEDRKFFTPMTIWRSGLLYTLYQKEQLKSSLISDDYVVICEQYGTSAQRNKLEKEYDIYKEIFWAE